MYARDVVMLSPPAGLFPWWQEVKFAHDLLKISVLIQSKSEWLSASRQLGEGGASMVGAASVAEPPPQAASQRVRRARGLITWALYQISPTGACGRDRKP